ncbi:MAG: META domain-containing protein [Alphaproteobacteria bacterium]|nr:META domain-containing protein [Alphaproteobacteria bacterium]
MKFKLIAAATCALALAACGDNAQNPEMLKGTNFVSAQPGVDISLSFDPEEMRVYGRVVNLYNGGYQADGNEIKFGEIASTMMMGPADAMETEQEYFQFIPTVEKYEFADGKLTLIGNDGKEIIFVQVEELPGDGATETTAE